MRVENGKGQEMLVNSSQIKFRILHGQEPCKCKKQLTQVNKEENKTTQ